MRALLLDLGNVLVRFDHGLTLTRIGAATGVPAESLRPHLFGTEERAFDCGEIGPEEFFRRVERSAGLPFLPDALWIPAWRDIFEPMPAALALLPRIRTGVRTAIVSNTNALHWEGVLRVAPVDRMVDALVLSFQVGAIKPDPRIWTVALERLRISPADAVFADDRSDHVEGARRFGIDSFLAEDTGSLERGLTQRDLLVPARHDGN